MSDFTAEGFAPFPNVYIDNRMIGAATELTDQQLGCKVDEYGAFLQRTDIMQRAKDTGGRVLDHLLFELACRDGVYDIRRIEDEFCA